MLSNCHGFEISCFWTPLTFKNDTNLIHGLKFWLKLLMICSISLDSRSKPLLWFKLRANDERNVRTRRNFPEGNNYTENLKLFPFSSTFPRTPVLLRPGGAFLFIFSRFVNNVARRGFFPSIYPVFLCSGRSFVLLLCYLIFMTLQATISMSLKKCRNKKSWKLLKLFQQINFLFEWPLNQMQLKWFFINRILHFFFQSLTVKTSAIIFLCSKAN